MAIHITNLLEYGGTAEDLIWKSDTVNFNNNSHVVVRESQEAIYVSNGVMSNTMGAGRHVLKSGNIPGLRQIRGFFQGEKAISTGEVYFFNLSVVRPIQWGTKEFVQIVDPIYQIPVRFGAGGTMYVRIGDSRKLLKKLTGTQQVFTRKDMDDFLRGILTSCVRNYLANEISSGKVSPLEFDKETERLSKKLEVILTEEFENYGLYLEKFYIERIPVKEEDIQTIRNVLAEHGARQLYDEKKNRLDRINAEKQAEIEQIKAKGASEVSRIEIDTKAYDTVISGRAINTVKAEEGQTQAQINQALHITEKERMALDVITEVAKNTKESSGEVFMTGGMIPGMAGKIPCPNSSNAEMVMAGIKEILKTDRTSTMNPEDKKTSWQSDFNFSTAEEAIMKKYRMEREFLKKDLEEGVITREEYRKELARLREKYADL